MRYIPCRWVVNRRTTLEICLGVNTLISTKALAVETGGSASGESNVAKHSLLPQVFRTFPPRGRARAARSVATNTIADLHGGGAFAFAPRTGEAVRAAEIARVVGRTLRKRTIRVSAFFPNFRLGWVISQAAPSTSHFRNHSPPSI